jgi:hypothetical protein
MTPSAFVRPTASTTPSGSSISPTATIADCFATSGLIAEV